jgi:hypothetical protein
MGVVLIGTYSAVPPTQAAQDALVRLLAWKSDQKNIDPLGKSYYYGCDISSYCRPYNPGAVVLNIAGHRQVTPTHTTCPGDQTIAYLPGIRERVKRMVNDESTLSGDPLVDDLTNGFQLSPSIWHEAACGYDSHTYWTYATVYLYMCRKAVDWVMRHTRVLLRHTVFTRRKAIQPVPLIKIHPQPGLILAHTSSTRAPMVRLSYTIPPANQLCPRAYSSSMR